MEYILIFIAAVFVNNVVLSQFLGICPFLGVSKKVDTAIGMGAAVAFVLTIATLVTFLVQKYVLDVFGLGFMQTISFILIIAALVQMVEIILKKVSPALYQALGVFLPLITTNCCVLGVAIQVIQKQYNLLESVVYAFSIAIGFALALIIFAGVREQLAMTNVPDGMKGTTSGRLPHTAVKVVSAVMATFSPALYVASPLLQPRKMYPLLVGASGRV